MNLPLTLAAAALPLRASPRVRIGLALAAVYAIWSSTYLALRVLVATMPAFLSAGARYVLAGVILLVILRRRGAPAPTRRQWIAAAPVGALLFLCGNGLVAYAEKTVASGIAAIACATTPLWAALLGRLVGDRISWREALGMFVGFGGVVVLCWGDSLRGAPVTVAILLCAPVGWAVGSLLARRLPGAPGLMSAATQMITGGVIMVIVGFALGERVPTAVPRSAALAWVYLVVFGSLVGFSAYSFLLRTTRTSVAMSYAYVNPALAVLLGAAALGEPLGVATLGAMGLVVAAVVLITRARAIPGPSIDPCAEAASVQD